MADQTCVDCSRIFDDEPPGKHVDMLGRGFVCKACQEGAVDEVEVPDALETPPDPRAFIRARSNRDTDPLEVPEWGVSIFVRRMGADEVQEMQEFFAGDDKDNIKNLVEIVIRGAAKKDGSRIFTDDDIEWLVTKEFQAIERIADTVLKFNGMVKDAVKDAAGNSDATPSDG